MADAVEAAGEHVEKEAADELAGRERHRLDPGGARDLATGAIVLPAEGDAVVVELDQTAAEMKSSSMNTDYESLRTLPREDAAPVLQEGEVDLGHCQTKRSRRL